MTLLDICNNFQRSNNSNQEYNTWDIDRMDLSEGRYCVTVSICDSSWEWCTQKRGKILVHQLVPKLCKNQRCQHGHIPTIIYPLNTPQHLMLDQQSLQGLSSQQVNSSPHSQPDRTQKFSSSNKWVFWKKSVYW